MESEAELVVLLIEDSQDDVFFFQRTLHKTGLRARLQVAEDGKEAIDYFKRENRFAGEAGKPQPHLVFLDLKMPRVNGFELLEWIGKEFPNPPFQILVLTSSDEPQDKDRAFELGAHGYFLKPMSVEDLSAAIERHKPDGETA